MKKSLLFISVGIFIILLVGVGVFVLKSANNKSTIISKVSDRELIEGLRESSSFEKINYNGKEYSKDYDASDKKLLIKDDKEEKILEIKLTSPYVVSNLVAGSDIKVAEFYLINWKKNRGILFNGVDYFDIKNNYEEVDKTFRYKWANESEECKGDKCYTHVRWVGFESLDELPHKNIRIGAFTQTERFEKIEFVPNINGFEILEWASWDIGSAVKVGEFDVSGEQTGPINSFLGKNGTKLYVVGEAPTQITEYNLTIANNISTAVFSTSVGLSTTGTALFFQQNGSRFYTCAANNVVSEHRMTIPWLINTTSPTASDTIALTGLGDCRGVYIKPDGKELYAADSLSKMAQFTMTTAWDISTASINGSTVATPWQTESQGLSMKIDGDKIYNSGVDFDTVTEVNLTTAWDIHSSVFSQNISIPTAVLRGVFFSDSGEIMLVADDTNNSIVQYNLPLTLSVTLNIPPNSSIFPTEDVSFNCSAISGVNLKNISLYIDGSLDTTIVSSTTSDELNTTLNLGEGFHSWTCNAVDDDDSIFWAMPNRTFSIDTTAPEVNITFPFDFIDYQIKNKSLTINWTVSDINLASCLGSFDGGVNNISLTCADNNITRNITSVNNDTFTFWAIDSVGNTGVISRTWIYRIFEVQQIFSELTTVGATETFVNNIFLGSGETITEINFNYNGTSNSAGFSNLGGGEYNLSSSLVIPSVSAVSNMSFFWIIDLVSGQINTTSKNQTVNNLEIGNCTAFSTVLFNYTIIDEETQNKITNITANELEVQLDIKLFDESKETFLLNFSKKYEDINPVEVCLNVNLTEETVYSIDSTVRYEAVNHSIEYYNIQNFLIKNSTIPQIINLFDLSLTDATEFQITFKDANFVVVEDALIQINRQYVSEGLFKTVEIPKTDSNGQTVAHLVEKDVVYNMIVLKEGVILGTFNNVIAFCEDVIIGSCFISLNALTVGEASFEYDEDIGLFFDFNYNESTRNLQFDFSTTDGSTKNVTLSALKVDQLGNTSVCTSFLVSSSGTIICPVPISVGNESIIVSIFVEGDLEITNYIQAGRPFDIGDSGYFLMFFLVLSLALMMTGSKTGVIIGVIIGFITGTLLSFVQGGLLGVGSSVIWLVIMGVILIYKLNSQGQT